MSAGDESKSPPTQGKGRASAPGGARAPSRFTRPTMKTVIVEKKRKRIILGAKPGAPVASKSTAKPAPATPAEEAPGRATPPAAPRMLRRGVVLRALTADEKKARAEALSQARSREEEDRARMRDEASAAASAEKKRLKEKEEAEARARALQEARAREDEARKRAEDQAARRLEGKVEEADDGKDAVQDRTRRRGRGMRVGRGDRKRREGKLTIAKALNEQERQRSLASIRRRRERQRTRGEEAPAPVKRDVVIPEQIFLSELAARMAVQANDVVNALQKQGMSYGLDEHLDADTAQLVAEEFGHRVKRVAAADVEEAIDTTHDKPEDLKTRPPVITVMGHVDHGKTSLLDALRQSAIAKSEKGDITQHIGAYRLQTAQGAWMTLIDTPGHAAFSAMRARGSRTTDIIILVIAADDGIMEQTMEAMSHARAAQTPVIVAITKMDKQAANPDRIRQALLEHDIVVEDMGGHVLCVPVCAHDGTGLDALQEAVMLQSELLDLKANPARRAHGVVLEARLERGSGHVATILVQRGTLRPGDVFVAGEEWGKVRALVDDRGKTTDKATPGQPVSVVGFNGTPEAGDVFDIVEDEARARHIADYRAEKTRMGAPPPEAPAPVSVDALFASLRKDDVSAVLPIIFKADTRGSLEAIRMAMQGLSVPEAQIKEIHVGVGEIAASDISLAANTGALVLGFGVAVNAQSAREAQAQNVETVSFAVIYDLINMVKKRLEALLAPERREIKIGRAEVLETFPLSKRMRAAGCRVEEGQIRKEAQLRLLREGVVLHEGRLASLRRFKDEVREVAAGQECGLSLDTHNDFQKGDIVECFETEDVARTLDG